MTLTVIGDDGPAADWRIEVSDDEPDEVRAAAAAITDEVQRGVRGKPKTATLIAGLEAARNKAKHNDGQPTEPMRRKLHAQANELLLDREDRLALTEMLLNVDCESWRDLTFDQASRLLDAMEGYVLIRHLRLERHGLTNGDTVVAL